MNTPACERVSIGWVDCTGGVGYASGASDGIKGAQNCVEAGLIDAAVPRQGAEGPEAGGSEEGVEACPNEDKTEVVELGAGWFGIGC